MKHSLQTKYSPNRSLKSYKYLLKKKSTGCEKSNNWHNTFSNLPASFEDKNIKKNKQKKLLLLIFLIRTIAIFLARGNLINVGVAHIQRAVVT